MTDHDAFVEAICERPEDDAPRLMYADWLMERGDPRGEFIRVQCELAKLIPEKSGGLTKWSSVDAAADAVRSDDPRVEKLLRRQGELLSTHGARWANPVASAAPLAYPMSWQWRRGFIAHVTLPHDVFLGHAAALFQAAPIEAVTLSDKDPSHQGSSWSSRSGWFRPGASWRAGRDDLDPELWFLLAAGDIDGNWCFYDTVEAANADLSAACVKLGRKRAAKVKKEMLNQ